MQPRHTTARYVPTMIVQGGCQNSRESHWSICLLNCKVVFRGQISGLQNLVLVVTAQGVHAKHRQVVGLIYTGLCESVQISVSNICGFSRALMPLLAGNSWLSDRYPVSKGPRARCCCRGLEDVLLLGWTKMY